MSILMKDQTPGPTLNVAEFSNMNTADILYALRERGIKISNTQYIEYRQLKRDKPPAVLDLYGFVPTSPVARTSALQQGLRDAGVESYVEAMAALAVYLRELQKGPESVFFTLLPIKGRDPDSREEVIYYIYCVVRRVAADVNLEFLTSLPYELQEGHRIKQSNKILVAFKKTIPKKTIFS